MYAFFVNFKAKEEKSEEKRKGLLKRIRDIEAELEDERKLRFSAVAGRKKIEADYKDLEQQLDMYNKLKEDALKQLKKLHVQLKDANHDAVEARASRDKLSALSKEMVLKLKSCKADILLLTEELSVSERARRVAESKHKNLLEEMNRNSNIKFVFYFFIESLIKMF